MNEPQTAASGRHRLVFAFAALAIVAVAALLYVKAGESRKKPGLEACAASKPLAARLAPLAKGEVAALNIAADPEPFATLSFSGPDGAPLDVAAFKGKTLLLNIWAAWCVPCRAEMPALDRLQQQLGSPSFEVVAINVDTSHLEKPRALLAELNIGALKFYSDPKADVFFRLRQEGGLTGLPTTFLIDPKGCEIGRMSGPAAWDSADAVKLIKSALGQEAN
ncbi:MAG: TlpA disulfide reductase family protein [Methylocystis sp.]